MVVCQGKQRGQRNRFQSIAAAPRSHAFPRSPKTKTKKQKNAVYRYLLFKSSREELVKDVDDLKKKITGEL